MGEIFGTVLGMALMLVVGIVVLALAISWIVLPFIVWMLRERLDVIIAHIDETIRTLQAMLAEVQPKGADVEPHRSGSTGR